MAYFITGYGWRIAYVILAIIVWITAIPALIVLGRSPPQGVEALYRGTSKTDDVQERIAGLVEPKERVASQAEKTRTFWMLMITGFVTAASFNFVAVHIVAYATDIGIIPTTAAVILTFMGGANILGKLLIPFITTRLGSTNTLLLLLSLQALALFLLMTATNLWAFFGLSSIFGFGFGATSPIRTSMMPEFFGLGSVGAMMGIFEIAWAVGAISGPILAGYVFDTTGSYDIAFIAAGLLIVAGIVATYFLKLPVRSLELHTNI